MGPVPGADVAPDVPVPLAGVGAPSGSADGDPTVGPTTGPGPDVGVGAAEVGAGVGGRRSIRGPRAAP